GVTLTEGAPAEGEVGLLVRLVLDRFRLCWYRRRRPYGRVTAIARPEEPGDRGDDGVVVDLSGGGDHRVRGLVMLGEERRDVVAAHHRDRLLVAEHLASERMFGEQQRRQQRVHLVVRRVL